MKSERQSTACASMKVMTSPRYIDVAITGKCNLHCLYCSHFTSSSDVDSDLPVEEWLLFFEELKQNGVMSLTLSGGEPFCRGDLAGIIDGIVRNRMRYYILSNGTLIDDEIASFLSGTGRCDGLQISIDGSSPDFHDPFRGEGAFSRAIDGLRALQRRNIPVSVRVTLHKENLHDIERVITLLLEDIGLDTVSTNSACYMGLCRENADLIRLDLEERFKAMETLLRLDAKYPGRIQASSGPLYDAKDWLEMDRARFEGARDLPGRGFLSGCSGPMTQMAVRADGIMIPCGQLGHIELGRINRDPLREVWQNHAKLKRLRERSRTPLTEFKSCRACAYLHYCTGGCPALSYTMAGDAYRPAPECLGEYLAKGGRLPG